MINRFFNKTAPIVGKYFRPVALVFLAGLAFLFPVGAVIHLIDSVSSILGGFTISGIFKIFLGGWALVWSIIFFALGVGALSILRKKPTDDDYKSWGVSFYFLILGLFVFLILKSKGIDLLFILWLFLEGGS